jgi:portal protein
MLGRHRKAVEARLRLLEASAPEGWAPLPPPDRATAYAGGGPLPWAFSHTCSRADAMAVPTLAFIRHQLAGGLSSMPLERYRRTYGPAGEPVTERLAPGWTLDPDPAPAISPSVFWSWVIDDLFFAGTSTLIVLARDSAGFPVAFRRVLPGQLTYDPDTLAHGMGPSSEVYYLGVRVPGEDVIAISGPHEGICNYGGRIIRAALALEENAATSAGEPLPNIDLHQTAGEPLSKEAAKSLVAEWRTARERGATAYTPQNLEARPLGFSATDQQLVEGRQYMATQLARLAGVSPVLVSAAMGAASSYVYSNAADYRATFLNDVLDGYLRAIEGRLSAGDVTPRGQYVEFDRDTFTRLPLGDRVSLILQAIATGAPPEFLDRLAALLGIDVGLLRGPDGRPSPFERALDRQSPPAPAPARQEAQ